MLLRRYEVPAKSPSGEERLYSCQLDRSNYLVFPATSSQQHDQMNGLQDKKPKLMHSPPSAGSPEQHNGLVKMEDKEMAGYHPANDTRQTVLMWGSGGSSAAPPVSSAPGSRPSSAQSMHGYVALHEQETKCKSPGSYMQQQQGDPLKSLAEMNSQNESKSWYQQHKQQQQRLASPQQYPEVWNSSPAGYQGAASYPGHYYMHHHHHLQHQHYVA
jgi:hypothetical protein